MLSLSSSQHSSSGRRQGSDPSKETASPSLSPSLSTSRKRLELAPPNRRQSKLQYGTFFFMFISIIGFLRTLNEPKLRILTTIHVDMEMTETMEATQLQMENPSVSGWPSLMEDKVTVTGTEQEPPNIDGSSRAMGTTTSPMERSTAKPSKASEAKSQDREAWTTTTKESVNVILDDLLIDDKNGGICGGSKCFFQSRGGRFGNRGNDTNTNNHNATAVNGMGIGYLVYQQELIARNEMHAYNFSLELSRKYPEIPHFYIPSKFGGRSEIQNLNEEYAAKLSSNIRAATSDMQEIFDKKGKKFRYYKPNIPLYVQPTYVAPEPNMVIGCRQNKLFQSTLPKLRPWIYEHVLGIPNNDNEVTLNNISTIMTTQKQETFQNFYDTFMTNMQHATRVSKNHTCLVWDWQVLLDNQGNMYHIDLDRCFETNTRFDGPRLFGHCVRNLQKHVIKQVKQIENEIKPPQISKTK